jgi:acetolactate synthase small subunit
MPSAPRASLPETEPTACFSILAAAEPGVMPRVLELFAKRGYVPTHWYSRRIGQELTIDVQMRGVDRDAAAYLAACMRQIATVEVVLTAER